MFPKLFILFAVVPLVELFLLIKVGGFIGAMNTIALVLLTAAVGAYLARDQGIKIFTEFSKSVNSGSMPQDPLIDGLFVAVGGGLLLTPGIMTDLIGLSFIIPQSRRLIRGYLVKFLTDRINFVQTTGGGGGVHFYSGGHRKFENDKNNKDDDDVIDV